jgi:hypothetical protein
MAAVESPGENPPINGYPCPECGSMYTIHTPDCELEGTDRSDIEIAYIDILSTLSVAAVTKSSLTTEHVEDWTDLHERVFSHLVGTQQVTFESDGVVRLSTHDESVAPAEEPLRTIYVHGTYPGCHDNGIFALMAYWANMGLSWHDTKTQLLDWFNRTGTWDRGGFGESSPEAVIDTKKHVWDEAYGWEKMGQKAKTEIEKRL